MCMCAVIKSADMTQLCGIEKKKVIIKKKKIKKENPLKINF